MDCKWDASWIIGMASFPNLPAMIKTIFCSLLSKRDSIKRWTALNVSNEPSIFCREVNESGCFFFSSSISSLSQIRRNFAAQAIAKYFKRIVRWSRLYVSRHLTAVRQRKTVIYWNMLPFSGIYRVCLCCISHYVHMTLFFKIDGFIGRENEKENNSMTFLFCSETISLLGLFPTIEYRPCASKVTFQKLLRVKVNLQTPRSHQVHASLVGYFCNDTFLISFRIFSRTNIEYR